MLRRAFPALDPKLIILTDEKYQVIDSTKAVKYASAISTGADNILLAWQADRKDCGKYAFLTTAIAQAGHACVVGPDAGLAIGMLHYRKDGDRGHQICIVLTKVPNKEEIHVMPFEPQDGIPVILTEVEKSTIEVIYM